MCSLSSEYLTRPKTQQCPLSLLVVYNELLLLCNVVTLSTDFYFVDFNSAFTTVITPFLPNTPPHWYSAIRIWACQGYSAKYAGRPPIIRFWIVFSDVFDIPHSTWKSAHYRLCPSQYSNIYTNYLIQIIGPSSKDIFFVKFQIWRLHGIFIPNPIFRCGKYFIFRYTTRKQPFITTTSGGVYATLKPTRKW